MTDSNITLRRAQKNDLDQLVALEQACFSSDRLSRRSFRHWIDSDHCSFVVATDGGAVVGYCLILYFRGTTLARLYSVAVSPACRGRGIADRLIADGEVRAREAGRLFLRLEVDVNNSGAIRLYEKLGYKPFGFYPAYYEDAHDALRMQKCIRPVPPVAANRAIPWLQQSTNFTCGPAALMMAMGALDADYLPSQDEELRIWREATTIFMTSGHGGCHPVGLALAARRRGFDVQVWLNQSAPLFVDGVRSAEKKQIISLVHEGFIGDARACGIDLLYREFSDGDLAAEFDDGAVPLVLISTYRLDGKKAPHWVAMSGHDSDCLYVHDPDIGEQGAAGLDSQFVPVARRDFNKMSRFGRQSLRTAVIVRSPGT